MPLPPPPHAAVPAAARGAFMTGLHAAMWLSVGLAVIAACAAFIGLPGKPKAQLSPPSSPVEVGSRSAE
jgi:hypothetical protein